MPEAIYSLQDTIPGEYVRVIEGVAKHFAYSPAYAWEVHTYDDLLQEAYEKFLRLRYQRDFLYSFNPVGYLYSSLRRHLLKLYINQKERHVEARTLAADIVELLSYDGGLEEIESQELWEEFIEMLTIAERYVLYWRMAGYTWVEVASKLTAARVGAIAKKAHDLRDKEVIDGRYLFRSEIRKLTVTVKQARGYHTRMLKKMRVFAVKHRLQTWLQYLDRKD